MTAKLKKVSSTASLISGLKGLGDVHDESVVPLFVNDIRPDPDQPRKSLQAIDGEIAPEDRIALESLAEDMYENGQHQPIVVKQMDDGMYQIIMGERRWRAAKLNFAKHDADTVKAIVRNDLSGEKLKLAQLAENLQREDLSDLETAMFLKKTLDEFPELQKQTLAKLLKKNSQYISRILALVDPAWASVVDTGIITYASLLEQFRALPESARNNLIATAKKEERALTSGDINKARNTVKGKDKQAASSQAGEGAGSVEWPFVEPALKNLTPQTIDDVSAFIASETPEAETYKYAGKPFEIVKPGHTIKDFGGDATIPAGVQALNPNLFDKREVKVTMGQLRMLLAADSFVSEDHIVTTMIPVAEVKNAIGKIGGEVPTDDNQLVLALIKKLNELAK